MDSFAPLEISTTQLREVFARVLDHVESMNGGTIKVYEDYFFSVPFPEIYQATRSKQPELTIGSLEEQWERLNSRVPESTLTFELVWLADVMRAIGHLGR
ncbi:hypothetical protein [Microbacterium oleivorans]|nr:hypothetical protein [Microbacterium oleivorans]